MPDTVKLVHDLTRFIQHLRTEEQKAHVKSAEAYARGDTSRGQTWKCYEADCWGHANALERILGVEQK